MTAQASPAARSTPFAPERRAPQTAPRLPYPGIRTTADGSGVIVWVETHIGEGACSYPITPTTNMGNGFQLAVANGQANLWGRTPFFLEPESEHSSASACEGFALAGGRVTNFTSGQGLVLMKEVLYTIAGKRLPVVFHIGARALSAHALNVHTGHDDIMAVSDTGWGVLFGRNAQEAHDLALIARRAAEASATPFMNVQDGFLTTHTIETVRLAEPAMMAEYIGNPREKLASAFDPDRPLMSGVVQNQDAYMRGKIAQRDFYDDVPHHLKAAFVAFHRLTGRHYDVIDTYRMDDAEFALVGLGSVMETAQAAVDWMRETQRWKVGAVHITSFRPFPGPALVQALRRCHGVAILERLDVPLAKDNPLTTEVKAAFADAASGAAHYPIIHDMPRFYSGVYGLGSRDTRVGDLVAVVENMQAHGRRFFSLGVEHASALPRKVDPDVRPSGAFSMRGHSIGGYGSVTTNKIIASLVGETFSLYVQAYPKYGSEKKGLPTTFYLTVAPQPIREHAELGHVDFVALQNTQAFANGDPLHGLIGGGAVFLQSSGTSDEDVWHGLPPLARDIIRRRRLRVYYLDTVAIARALAATADLQLRMQGIVLLGVFLRAAPFVLAARHSEQELFMAVEAALRKQFARADDAVIAANLQAVKRGFAEVHLLNWLCLPRGNG